MSLVVDFRLSNDKKNFFTACKRSDKSFIMPAVHSGIINF